MSDIWPTQMAGLVIEVLHIAEGNKDPLIEQDAPFICGVIGPVWNNEISDIEDQLRDDPPKKQGMYLYTVRYDKGEFDEYGRCECKPYYDLTEIGYKTMEQLEAEKKRHE